MKESFYFKHDTNAQSDPKIERMIATIGWEGYGLYWALVEKLYQQQGSIPYDAKLLGFSLNTDSTKIQEVAEKYQLFYFKYGKLRSRSVDRRLSERREKQGLARLAGLASAEARECQRTFNGRSTDVQPYKREKEKEREREKEKEIGTPFQSLFCSYKDKGQGSCQERKEPNSKYCPEHKLKVHEKYLTKQEILPLPKLKTMP